ncbi:putative ADP-ribosylation factor-like 2-like protein [Hyaloraphidium curvatum]|nr:putative ADP-ribosylation factor-like 2-like protein [Hyaloraphidium curvatum]
MGLLTIIRKARQKEKEMRILVLGLDNAGKTTICKRIMGMPIDTISPTLGFNIETLEHKGYKLNIWDIGGQRTIRPYWRNYFESTDGLVFVVDASDPRITDARAELGELLKEERLAGASLLVFANKQDLPGARTVDEIARLLGLEEGAEMLKGHHWAIQGCSAYTGQNLLTGLDWLVADVGERLYLLG